MAFVTGYDAARGGSVLAGFRLWLIGRDPEAPSAGVPDLVLRAAALPATGSRSAAEDERATRALFDLLDEYLASRDPTGPADPA